MKKIIVLIGIYLLYTHGVYAEVSQFVFTNEQRSVAPGVISESLTVQSQNSGSAQESIAETTDLVFQSSSPTGEFLNSSGNPVSTTMSKNTANRTFYYRDSTTGNHTLTVTATGRDTAKVFKATQMIVVGNSQSAIDQNQNNSTTTSTSGTTSSSGDSLSSHSNPSPASDSKTVMNFEVSAGRKRFTSIASEVVFKAEPLKLSGVPENYIQYTWSFGDGTTANGQVVNHRYRFAGDYVVVLNAVYSDKSAVSRTDVSVIKPMFSVGVIDGGVLVKNNSSGEVNMGEWVIEGARNRLELPRDTIIEKGKSIVFSYTSSITDTDTIVLKDPLGGVVAERVFEVQKEELEHVIPQQIANQKTEPIVKIVYIDRPIIKKEVLGVTTTPEKKEEVVENISSESLVANVYTGSEKVSALESFLWIPKKGWGILAELFR